MPYLDELISTPRLLEVNTVELAAAPAVVWQHVRHADLGDSPWVRALFSLRALPSRVIGKRATVGVAPLASSLRIDDLRSTAEEPGFAVLHEDPGTSVSVGAIGQVWQLDIPFQHVEGEADFATFARPGWIKVAWEIRVAPLGERGTLLEFEVRVDATDAESWAKFTLYWKLIGPGSHFIRRVVLKNLEAKFGSPEASEEQRSLAGDDWLKGATAQLTQGITIHASPAAIWPWLVQMGCQRAGYYSVDLLDNGAIPSAREIHPDLQSLHVGQVLPATLDGPDGFEVLAIAKEQFLILGGLFDVAQERQLEFAAPRPGEFWQVTWAFVLEPEGERRTRLTVRARAVFSPSEKFHAAWIRPVHRLMQSSQLRHLAQRAEGKLARDTWRDVGEGVTGAAIIAAAFLTPFWRGKRNHWGLTAAEAAVPRPGDELITDPDWSWTHAVELDAPPETVWPWVAQIGADRAGFYSYQWLENLVGCQVHNAERVHDEWAHHIGDTLILHPEMPPIPVVTVITNHCIVAYGAPDAAARQEGKPWTTVSWAFVVEPLDDERSRLVSRFRSSSSHDLPSHLAQGPTLLEPIGFAMDRRMLLGIKQRVEATRKAKIHASHDVSLI